MSHFNLKRWWLSLIICDVQRASTKKLIIGSWYQKLRCSRTSVAVLLLVFSSCFFIFNCWSSSGSTFSTISFLQLFLQAVPRDNGQRRLPPDFVRYARLSYKRLGRNKNYRLLMPIDGAAVLWLAATSVCIDSFGTLASNVLYSYILGWSHNIRLSAQSAITADYCIADNCSSAPRPTVMPRSHCQRVAEIDNTFKSTCRTLRVHTQKLLTTCRNLQRQPNRSTSGKQRSSSRIPQAACTVSTLFWLYILLVGDCDLSMLNTFGL